MMDRARLELSEAEMRALGSRIVDLLVEHYLTISEKPVSRRATRREMESVLREPPPEQPSDPLSVVDRAWNDIFGHAMPLTHPRFFAFVPSPSNFVSAMAEALIAGFNAFNGSWLVASGPAEAEVVVVDWLRQICGLPEEAGGLFVSGGSVASLLALAAARHVKLDDRTEGAVVYLSDQTHSAVTRGLHVLGFAPDQVRVLPSDGAFQLPVGSLEEAVSADRAAGRRPFCVVANAGTTNTGAVDPLHRLAQICRREELWFHVDGAYGGAAVLTEQGRTTLAGLEMADSLVLDPHKWLFQPFEAGCLLVRDRFWLSDTFAVHPEYLKDVSRSEEEVNFRDYGIQLTRNFRALKLWMSLEVFGLEAFRDAVGWGLRLAEHAERRLRGSPHWDVVTPAQLGIVTFRWRSERLEPDQIDALNQRIIDAMTEDGFAYLSSTALHGRTVLRLCSINPRTTENDVEETIDRLEVFGKRLEQAGGGDA